MAFLESQDGVFIKDASNWLYLTQKDHWLIKVSRASGQSNKEPCKEPRRDPHLWPSFQGTVGAGTKHIEVDLGPEWNCNPLTNAYSLV